MFLSKFLFPSYLSCFLINKCCTNVRTLVHFDKTLKMIKFSTHVWYFKSSILSMDRRANLLTQFKCLVTVKTVKIKFAPVSSVYKRVAHSNQGCLFAIFIMKLYRSSYSVIQLFFREWRHRSDVIDIQMHLWMGGRQLFRDFLLLYLTTYFLNQFLVD